MAAPSVAPGNGKPKRRRFHRIVRWPALQQALYLRQLTVMFSAGIPIHRAASVVSESDEHPPEVKNLLMEIPRDLERGRMLSKCLDKSGLFGRLVVSTVKLGEESGHLDRVLGQLADAKEESVRLRRTLVSRLTYPAVVLLAMSLGLVVMGHVMSQVMSSLPNFKPEDVPLFGLVNVILGSRAFLPVCLLIFAGLFALLRYILKNRELRMFCERKIFAIPVFGGVLRRLEASTVTRQLSLLLSAGLPIDRGMELCSELVFSECFRESLLQSQKALREGAELAECFKSSALFPDDVMALITAGEISGQLEDSLSRGAEYCADQVERSLETLLALIEPLMIGFLGITIGVVLLCTFVPVFNSLQTM